MPLENATAFLKEHEGYDREYYSGYLGPVNFNSESNIFVNLRCMQVQKEKGWCYAGAGITIDSESDQEWLETEMKMNTLLDVLNP
jgi:isochorismate synthase